MLEQVKNLKKLEGEINSMKFLLIYKNIQVIDPNKITIKYIFTKENEDK